jgi:hypothetical protein
MNNQFKEPELGTARHGNSGNIQPEALGIKCLLLAKTSVNETFVVLFLHQLVW